MRLSKNLLVILSGIYFVLMSCVSVEDKKDNTTANIENKEQDKEYSKKLDESTLNEVTTCKYVSLNRIKKNLILMSYEIESLNSKGLITKYRLYDSDGGGKKVYDRIIVTKVNRNTIRFKKMEKYEDLYMKEKVPVVSIYDEVSFEKQKQKYQELDACKRKNPDRRNCDDYSTQQAGWNLTLYPSKNFISNNFVSDTASTTYEKSTKVYEYEPTYYLRKLDSYRIFKDKVCGKETVNKTNKNNTPKYS